MGKSQNGEVDYKKLWEESQSENSRLRTEMSSIRTDLDSTRHQLESAIQASTKNSISDSEKREKKMLEKKLSEMEEELKVSSSLGLTTSGYGMRMGLSFESYQNCPNEPLRTLATRQQRS